MENVQDNQIQDLGQSFQASPAVVTAQPTVNGSIACGQGMQLVFHNHLFLFLLFHTEETQILTESANLLGQVHIFTLFCHIF